MRLFAEDALCCVGLVCCAQIAVSATWAPPHLAPVMLEDGLWAGMWVILLWIASKAVRGMGRLMRDESA